MTELLLGRSSPRGLNPWGEDAGTGRGGGAFVAGMTAPTGRATPAARSASGRNRAACGDELGYLPFETNAAHLFFQLVSRRYERGSVLITSNRAVGQWGSVFGDPVVATAILDRLLHHSHVIIIRGDSNRRREKRRSGLIKATLGAEAANCRVSAR